MRVLYLLYTFEKNIKKAQACLKTWAKNCKNVVVVSNKQKNLNYSHLIVKSDGYENLSEKTCLMWEQVWHRYGQEFDYFVKVDDDTYVFPDNLERNLASDRPEFFGNYSRWRSPDSVIIKWITGSFYGFSQKTLQKMVIRLKEPKVRNEFLDRGPAEDVAVSVVLSELGIEPIEWSGIYICERQKTLKAFFSNPGEMISVTNLTPMEIKIMNLGRKMLWWKSDSSCKKLFKT